SQAVVCSTLCSTLAYCRRFFLLESCATPRLLHSFPTRRSSDLLECGVDSVFWDEPAWMVPEHVGIEDASRWTCRCHHCDADVFRSEEHTSELQSHLNLVCRLLLEKKNSIERTTGALWSIDANVV